MADEQLEREEDERFRRIDRVIDKLDVDASGDESTAHADEPEAASSERPGA